MIASTGFQLDDHQRLLLDVVRDLVTRVIAPRAEQIDETGEFPWDVVAAYREQGLPIPEAYGGGEFPLIDTCLVCQAIKIDAARYLAQAAARAYDERRQEATRLAAEAKTFASDTAMSVTTDAVQVLGGYGYCRDFPVERMMRDAKLLQIFDGTNQSQRVVIARELARAWR